MTVLGVVQIWLALNALIAVALLMRADPAERVEHWRHRHSQQG
jgi:hypothetical protein